MESLLANLETLLLVLFAACALVGAVLVLVLPEPMRVATALISTMVFLGGVYGLLGVHFIAAFQVLIYVGAVMVCWFRGFWPADFSFSLLRAWSGNRPAK